MFTSAQIKAIHQRLENYTAPVWLSNLLLESIGFVGRLLLPSEFKHELKATANALDVSFNKVVCLNLDYELGGGCCTSAAIPVNETYHMVRALDWEIPPSLRNAIRWKELPENPNVRHRAVPGFIGTITSHDRANGYGVCINQADSWDINPAGTPITWLIRELLGMDLKPDEFVKALLHECVMVDAYVIVVSRKRAWWIHMGAGRNQIVRSTRYPNPLCVCNEYNVQPAAEKNALIRWAKRSGRKVDVPFPVYNADTADLVVIAP